MPKPKYTATEIARNTAIVGVALMRRGRLTTRQKRILEQTADKARDRGTK